jgi:hypothetical protein
MQAGNPNSKSQQAASTPNFLAESIDGMRKKLLDIPPLELAQRTGTTYDPADGGQFRFRLWQEEVIVSVSDMVCRSSTGKEHHLGNQALVIHYFTSADGGLPEPDFVSYGDLPGGRIYAAAFQGYAGDKLSRHFENDLERLAEACRIAGGEKVDGGDLSYEFQALPRIRIRVNYWMGDEDFPANARLCFEPTACHYLPIDVCAILGSMLVGRLIKAAPAK